MHKITTIVFIILITTSLSCFAKPNISFHVSMEKPHTHYYKIEMNVRDIRDDSLIFKLPVWTPGYYKIMDYPIHLSGFKASTHKTETLSWGKNSKNTWVVRCPGENEVTIEYKIYAYKKSVADCYLDSEMGFICPTGLFMYIDGYLNTPSKIKISPFEGWNKVSTGLNRLSENGFIFQADNFDQLYDCPILLGNHNEIKFDVENIPYTIAYSTKQKPVNDSILDDLKKVIKTSTGIFGQVPYDNYTFIIMENGYGGLEHQNSMAIFSDIPNKSDVKNYKDWLSFIAHEFFHLYNVKAIRPINLGPFDYERENYTNMLWVSEGFTVYYENSILLRAGLINEEEFLGNMSGVIKNYENTPGRLYQSATQSSFDAWIDFFQFKENKKNTSISYYDKGCALGMLLDLKIRHETRSKKNLDDVMRQLYNEFYIKKQRGFTNKEFRAVCEEISNCSLDEIFEGYAATTVMVDYSKYLDYAGLTIDTSTKVLSGAFLGFDLSERNGRIIIVSIVANSPAEKAGLSIHDEIVKLNNKPVTAGMSRNIQSISQPGKELNISVLRMGKELVYKVIPTDYTTKTFDIQKGSDPNKTQELILKNWLLN